MERKSRARSESAAFIAVVAIALVVFNILAIKIFFRWDLTKRKLFTLSEGTERIVRGLHDKLIITVYFTPEQPPPYNDERFVRDQLEEYRAIVPGRVQVRYIATDNDQRRHDAETAGCTKNLVQAVDTSEGQAEAKEVFRCLTFEYLGKREKIEFLPSGSSGLEYEISSILKNLNAPEGQRDRTVGFLGGHGELTPEEGMPYLSQLMEQERLSYHTRTVNLNNGDAEVPSDIKGLIIANPSRQISEKELQQLDAYLMRGGAIALFTGGLNFASTDPTSATGAPAEHHLNDWLDHYGIHLDGNVVLDPRSTDGVIRVGRQMGRVRLVTWPVIAAFPGTPSERDLQDQGGLDSSFPAVFRLPEFITTYPSTITINDQSRRQAGGTLRVFARTGPRSVLRTSDFDMNIVEILQQGRQVFEGAARHGPFTVGVALNGPFKTAYPGQAPAPSAGDAGVTGSGSSQARRPERSSGTARLMVVSSGSVFALDTLRIMAQLSGGQRPGNLSLLFNTFDWLSQDTDLLAVRAKDTSEPSIRADVSKSVKQTFQWGMIVGLPLVIGALGVAIMSGRRQRRRAYVRVFGPADSGKA